LQLLPKAATLPKNRKCIIFSSFSLNLSQKTKTQKKKAGGEIVDRQHQPIL